MGGTGAKAFFPRSYPEEPGLDLREQGDGFKWFLAPLLFGRRISTEIALRTLEFERRGYTTPEKVLEAGWHKLVEALDEGGIRAPRLLRRRQAFGDLQEAGGGGGTGEAPLLGPDHSGAREEADGVQGDRPHHRYSQGAQGYLEGRPSLSSLAGEMARRLGTREGRRMRELEPKLVRLAPEYCKRKRCSLCSVRGRCEKGMA